MKQTITTEQHFELSHLFRDLAIRVSRGAITPSEALDWFLKELDALTDGQSS